MAAPGKKKGQFRLLVINIVKNWFIHIFSQQQNMATMLHETPD